MQSGWVHVKIKISCSVHTQTKIVCIFVFVNNVWNIDKRVIDCKTCFKSASSAIEQKAIKMSCNLNSFCYIVPLMLYMPAIEQRCYSITGELQTHLRGIFQHLRPQDNIKLVRNAFWYAYVRFICWLRYLHGNFLCMVAALVEAMPWKFDKMWSPAWCDVAKVFGGCSMKKTVVMIRLFGWKAGKSRIVVTWSWSVQLVDRTRKKASLLDVILIARKVRPVQLDWCCQYGVTPTFVLMEMGKSESLASEYFNGHCAKVRKAKTSGNNFSFVCVFSSRFVEQ